VGALDSKYKQSIGMQRQLMNSYERMIKRLNGEPVDRPPNFNIFMTFASHHINKPLSQYYLDYKVLVDANLRVLEDFDLDIVQAISDPYREAADFGAEIIFPDDDLPISKTPLLKNLKDIDQLVPPTPNAGKRMSDRVKAVQRFKDQVGGGVPIMGWVEGALAEAADLRGVSTLLMDLILQPDWVKELLEISAEVAIAFAISQLEAGADIIGLGDAIASQCSLEMYRQFALPYEKRIFDAVHQHGGIARLHICGDTTHLLADLAQSGADIVDLDWMVDIGRASALYAEDGPALCGNFDPVAVLLNGTPDEVAEATQECLEKGGARLFSGAGCEVPDGTPHANLHMQNEVLKVWNQID